MPASRKGVHCCPLRPRDARAPGTVARDAGREAKSPAGVSYLPPRAGCRAGGQGRSDFGGDASDLTLSLQQPTTGSFDPTLGIRVAGSVS